MKTKITIAILSLLITVGAFAQGKNAVYAANSDISDNLDLKAVASIFGDSKDLADFEYRLNDPNLQISNLDLNNDNMVDYLRVIEMVQNNTHLVVLQAVLQQDVYQDVATIAISKKKNRKVHVQVIGDPYMYGSNYIYEPVYFVTPPLYTNFWISNYRPYRSYYGWNHYPKFYTSWNPYAYGHYYQNIYVHINHNNYYNYTSNIYNPNANNYYRKYRNNAYEQKYPNRNFAHRTSQTNRYEYDRIQKESGRSPQATAGLRPSSKNHDEVKTATVVRPTISNGTRSNSSVRPLNSNAIRPKNTVNATTRPATSSSTTPVSNNTARPTTTTNGRQATTASASYRSQNATSSRPTNSATQRGSASSTRSAAATQISQQRGVNNSARSSQQNSDLKRTSTTRSNR